MTTRARLLVLCLLAACPGGGGDDTSGDGTATTGETSTEGPPTTGDAPEVQQIDRLCAHTFSCGCQPAGFDTEAECRASLAAQIDLMRSLAAQHGLIYDASCFTADADYYVDLVQCHTEDELAKLPKTCRFCEELRGEKAKGEACSPKFGDYTDCGPGLRCDSGVCVDPCNPLAAGEPCMNAAMQSLGDCDEGLFCTADRTCQPEAKAGESCAGNICADGLACDEAAPGGPVCRPRGQAGEPCTYGCAKGFECDTVVLQCVALPAAGEGCLYGQCSEGLHCSVDDVCEPPPGPGDPCLTGCSDPALYCTEDLTCAPRLPAGSPCQEVEDCADNTVCASGTCQPQAPVLCVPP